MSPAEIRIIARFASNWGLAEEEVEGVLALSLRFGYGKSRRLLTKFGYGTTPTVRQIRYLTKNVRLTRRYGEDIENYREMVQRKA